MVSDERMGLDERTWRKGFSRQLIHEMKLNEHMGIIEQYRLILTGIVWYRVPLDQKLCNSLECCPVLSQVEENVLCNPWHFFPD